MRIPLDAAAACCTGSSTLLLAFHYRTGWLMLAAGVCLWMGVALKGRLGDRPIWWMLAANMWTFTFAIYAYISWGQK